MTRRASVWVCQACGREAARRDKFKDGSCVIHAVEVWVDTIQRNDNGRIVAAEAVR